MNLQMKPHSNEASLSISTVKLYVLVNLSNHVDIICMHIMVMLKVRSAMHIRLF